MEPISAFASISKAIDAVKALKDFEKKFDAAQFKLQLAELTEALADAKLAVVSLKEELTEKDSEISNLKSSLNKKAQTIVHDGFSYEVSDEEQPFGYPYCNRCMEVDGLMIKVVRNPISSTGSKTYCPQCKTAYRSPKAEVLTAFSSNTDGAE